MSKELVSFLENRLKPAYNESTNTFDESVQEEYLGAHGWLNKTYIMRVLHIQLSTASFRSDVKQVFGTAEFNRTTCLNEVTQEEFNKAYLFGKFAVATGWIGFFYEKNGKVLTREKLFEYILQHVEPHNGIRMYAGGLRSIKQDPRVYFDSSWKIKKYSHK